MITIVGKVHDGFRRGQLIVLRHATLARNLLDILSHGILTSKSQGRYKGVWLHESSKSEWAALHTVQRHGGDVRDVVIIEVEIPKTWLRRHGGKTAGVWRCVRDIKIKWFRRIVDFDELAASPIKRVA